MSAGTRKDTQYQVVSVQGNQLSVKKVDTGSSSKSSSKVQAGDQAGAQSKQDEFEKSKSYPFEIVPLTKRKDPDSFEMTSAFQSEVNSSEDAAGVFLHASHDVMPSPRQTFVGPSSKLEVQGHVSPAPVDVPSSSASSAAKQRKKSKVKVAVSFDDKMLNSTLRAALQFLCDITCKSNKYLDYQRLFMTENTLKYLIQVVQILGQSEKLLHQEIAVVAVKYVCEDATC